MDDWRKTHTHEKKINELKRNNNIELLLCEKYLHLYCNSLCGDITRYYENGIDIFMNENDSYLSGAII